MSRCDLDGAKPRRLGENTFVVASRGAPLGSIPSARNRQPLPLRRISPKLRKATIAIEDRRFWDHDGVDVRGILRAAVTNVVSRDVVQGASTISQQLARTLYLDSHDVSLSRKLDEACFALRLENRRTKRQILAAYLNDVFYGNNAYGAEAAARTYFSKSAARLTLPEAALLAGLPQAPSVYDPLANRDAARARRDEVLSAMLDAGYIRRRDYERVVAAGLGLRRGRHYAAGRERTFVSYVQRELEHDLGKRVVRSGGLRIRTTLDLRLQRAAVRAMRQALPSRRDPASAIVAIDPRTGAIRALAGVAPGRKRLQFNLATQSRRQAGSAFKPVALAAAIEQGIAPDSLTPGPSEIEIGDPRCRTNGKPWRVSNYGDERFGLISVHKATVNSVNTVFAQISAVIGPEAVVAMAHRLGIRSPLDPVCSLALGSEGVSPLDLTSVYATFAAGGVHRAPQAIAGVRARDGRVLRRLDPAGEQVLHPDHATLVTYALRDVIRKGTGTAASLSVPAAGKTGTTEEYRDAWFCGYVPRLAACVWIGYPQATIPLRNVEGWDYVFGGSIPARIWRQFMTAALRAA